MTCRLGEPEGIPASPDDDNHSDCYVFHGVGLIFICAKVALLVMRLQGENLGSQMRFSDAYLLDLFECL